MGFNSLSDILNYIRARHPQLGARIKESEAVMRWEAAVGAAIAKHARALKVQDGSLWIEVDHPIWRSELHHRKQQILKAINAGAAEGEEAVKDLFLVEPRRQR